MKVYEILPRFKANNKTYYNLSRKDIIIFKDLYNYLKKHKEKNIGGILIENQIKTINNIYDTDYLIKYKSMELISYNIIH